MKKLLSVLAGICVLATSIVTMNTANASVGTGDGYSSNDWKPFNYVLTTGAGSRMQYNDIRTNLSYENNKLTASGRTTSGGMGVSFLPEIDITDFSINFSCNSWQKVSTDRWFGFSFTDVLQKQDKFNEVPFYSKHSESWSNDYGAGSLFAIRPAEGGQLTIQFNYIGIEPSFDADGNYNTKAGEYSDGYLGWGGYISTIQLCNEDWSMKTDYNDIEVTMKGIREDGKDCIAYEINGGYWYRTDMSYHQGANALGLTKEESNFEQDVFSSLDLDKNGYLSESEFNNFICGSAWNNGADKKSINTYANYGDNFYSLAQYNKKLKEAGKRLYMSFMYKDAWDIREGSDDASFTINTVNGKPATDGENVNLTASKTVEGDIKATLTETSLHAGVYPSTIKELIFEDVDATSYTKAKSAIEEQANRDKMSYRVVNVKAKTTDDKVAKIISQTDISVSLETYQDAKFYKVVGSDIDAITTTEKDGYATFSVNSSDVNIVVMTKGGNTGKNNGCASNVLLSPIAALPMLIAALVISKKK